MLLIRVARIACCNNGVSWSTNLDASPSSWWWCTTISEDLTCPLSSMASIFLLAAVVLVARFLLLRLRITLEVKRIQDFVYQAWGYPGNSAPKSSISFWSIYFSQLIELATKARDLVKIPNYLLSFIAILSLIAIGFTLLTH